MRCIERNLMSLHHVPLYNTGVTRNVDQTQFSIETLMYYSKLTN